MWAKLDLIVQDAWFADEEFAASLYDAAHPQGIQGLVYNADFIYKSLTQKYGIQPGAQSFLRNGP